MPTLKPTPLVSEERRLQMLIDAVTDYAIYMIDLSGQVASWNTGAERIKGYSADEIIGQHFSRFFTEEDRRIGLPEKALSIALEKGRYEVDGWRVRKDGSRFWASSVLDLVRDEDGRPVGFAKVTRDITERRQAQEELYESERRFRMLVDGLTDYAMCTLDPYGIVTQWNAGARRVTGFADDDIVGHHFSHFYTREDRAAGTPARVLEIAERHGVHEAEGWHTRHDGSRFWATVTLNVIRDKDGMVEGFARIVRDITERRDAQEALRDSERQFRMLVSGVTDYAIFMLDPNGIVANWNAGAQKIKGYRADEVIGQHFSRFYTDVDRAAGVPAHALAAAARDGRVEMEGWRVRKDGTLFFANVVIDAIRDETGKLLGFAKVTRDITERRKAAAELQRIQEQLAQSQKMEALGKLTGGIAHDFNNLLMIVNGHAQILRRLLPKDDAKLAKSLEAILSAASSGEALTRQMLAFARRKPLSPELVEVRERIEAFRATLPGNEGGKVRLNVSILDGIWPVFVDGTELELALLNLAVNARDAMPDGGAMTISAENVSLGSSNSVEGLTGDFVAICVADEGVGIPPDILPKVFDPFFTTKQVDKGTGLGLSQVYSFAVNSGGAVTVHSELGHGATVTIYLPRGNKGQAGLEEASHASTDLAQNRRLHVLLVEDNSDVAAVTASMLEQLDHKAQIVNNADSALEMLERGARFDLVLSDIVMAGKLDGYGLAHVVRERFPDLPVLLATGYSRAVDAAESEFPILRKPYQMLDLSRAIRRLFSPQTPTDPTPTTTNLVDFSAVRRNRAKS